MAVILSNNVVTILHDWVKAYLKTNVDVYSDI